MNVLGIVPARGGSKRIQNKNLQELGGRTLLEHAIQTGLEATQVSRTVVSTDDVLIAEKARAAGAEVPFMRPAELARDETPDAPVLRHAFDWCLHHEGYQPEIVVLLRPTTPFRTADHVDTAIRLLVDSGASIVRSVTPVRGVHHPYWMYQQGPEGLLHPLLPEVDLERYFRAQTLPPVMRLAGVVDAYRAEVVLAGTLLSSDNLLGMVVEEQDALDIDTPLDLRIAEALWRSRAREAENS